MATPFDARLGALPEPERAEINKLLAERPRDLWHSDEGDGLAFHLLFAVAALAGAVACVYQISTSHEYLQPGLDPVVLGLILAVLLLALILWRFLTLHGRHGWLVTSFGYLRVRGPRLRLVRWPAITRVQRRVIGSGRGKFVMIDLTTANGTLECDTAVFYGEIKRRVPASTTVED